MKLIEFKGTTEYDYMGYDESPRQVGSYFGVEVTDKVPDNLHDHGTFCSIDRLLDELANALDVVSSTDHSYDTAHKEFCDYVEIYKPKTLIILVQETLVCTLLLLSL
jgi:hypothetical protein